MCLSVFMVCVLAVFFTLFACVCEMTTHANGMLTEEQLCVKFNGNVYLNDAESKQTN